MKLWLKKKRKPRPPHGGAGYYFSPPWKTRKAPEAPSETPWCSRDRQRWDRPAPFSKFKQSYGKVRCPDCGRRLQLMHVDIEQGYGDFWPYLPPHKVRELTVKADPIAVKTARKNHKKRGFGAARGK